MSFSEPRKSQAASTGNVVKDSDPLTLNSRIDKAIWQSGSPGLLGNQAHYPKENFRSSMRRKASISAVSGSILGIKKLLDPFHHSIAKSSYDK